MWFRLLTLVSLLALLPLLSAHAADETDTVTPTGADEPALEAEPEEEPPPQPPEEEEEPAEQPRARPPAQPPAQEETGLDDEGLFEDALPETPLTEEDRAKLAAASKKIDIDAVVVVKYTFASSAESYSVKYHISLSGDLNNEASFIKGNAKVATDISGYLSKTAAFECALKVSIADVPYEIMFKKVSDTEADINLTFKGQILEDWESLCTFLDTSGAKFNTRGSPERWIASALEKAKPPLNKLPINIDPTNTTTGKFVISKYTAQDEGLGSAEIEGTGVVTIKPRLPTEKPEMSPESRRPARSTDKLARKH